jgi:Spy/CpxP family protein refolding chaperone
MKTICISIALFFAAAITVNAQEQLNQRGNRRPVLVDDIRGERLINIRQNSSSLDNLGLSNEQHEQITKLQAEMQKGLDQLNNQLSEKQAHLQTLETQNAVNMKAVNKNIDEQAKLMAKQMKLKAEYKQKIRAALDKEQRGRFDAWRE